MTVKLVTIPNVPILTTGRDYQLSTGNKSFTSDMLPDAVAASREPGESTPRLKLGHTDPRFNGGFTDLLASCLDAVSLTRDQVDEVLASASRMEAMFDAEPAIGRAVNLRLSDDGHTIRGDLEDVPEWIPAAYPGRSIEALISPEGIRTDVTSSTGRSYRMVIDAVALLGATLPAIKTLDDVRMRITGPDSQETTMPVEHVAASVATSDVIDQYNARLCANPTYSQWWVRETVDDPDGLIVDTGDGLVLVPYTIDAEGSAAFGEPAPVRRAYVDAADTERVAASAGTRALNQMFASQAESRPESIQQEDTVDPQIRERLGLGNDATEEQVTAALLNRLDAADAAQTTQSATPTGEGEQTDPAAAVQQGATQAPGSAGVAPAADPAAPTTAPAADQTVTVDKGALEQLQASARRGDEARQILHEQECERIVASAMGAGKFGPASKDGWLKRLRNPADFVMAKADLDGLTPGLIPGAEQGSNGGVGDVSEQELATRVLAGFGINPQKGA